MPLLVPTLPAPSLLDRPVAILGAGLSGRAVAGALATLGAMGVFYDEKAADTVKTFGAKEAGEHRLVVFSPGFAPGHPWLAAARAAGCLCLGELDFASFFWRGRVVAVTGTNGKTTLTEFLTHALTHAGCEARAVGNVGFPFSRLAGHAAGASAIAVCEVSSFQAETLQHFAADATLWTNFAEDHLERHPGLGAYFNAKWNLVARTRGGAVFAGTSVQRHAGMFGKNLPAAGCVASEGRAADERLAGTVFADYPQRENFLLAEAWWLHAGFAGSALLEAARTFVLGRHRLALAGERRGVTFWNDSKATNFHAVEAALARFDRPVLWIGGGRAKGGDLAAFIRRIAGNVKHAFLIGETKSMLATFCAASQVACTVCATLEEAVRAAFALGTTGDHVLLSPGFASFDMFRGYEDRGSQFEALVNNL